MDTEPIQVMIAWDTESKLASAYNRAMERATSEWVLFLDHDIFLCNRHWYQMCVDAINLIGDRTGWISAVTNRIGNPGQKVKDGPMSHDIREHCAFARKLYEMHGSNVQQCRGAMSGFWLLTNKTVWKEVGGFDENKKRLYGVDNRYSGALNRAGYMHFKLPGLYVYHMYGQKKLFQRW